jgi:hypothetical protein
LASARRADVVVNTRFAAERRAAGSSLRYRLAERLRNRLIGSIYEAPLTTIAKARNKISTSFA